MASVYNLGSTVLHKIGAKNNNYARILNDNMIRATMLFNPAVESRVTALPEDAGEGTMYIDPSNQRLSMWVDFFDDNLPNDVAPRNAGWYQLMALPGQQVYVRDEDAYYMMTYDGSWDMLIDVGAEHRAIEREFSFYAPYRIRPNSVMFEYVAGMEFTIEAGAPNSGANLDVAPVGGNVVFSIYHLGAVVGTVTFAAGSTVGVISFPAEVIVQPVLEENLYVRARVLTIRSPADTFECEGMQMTLRGKVRAID